MRIVFVRHGEPDYSKDSLTEKGWREARLLAGRISKWKVEQFYCSPLGRARDTASCTLKAMNREAVILPYMREFSYPIDDPITGRHGVPWDFVPSFWSSQPLMYDQRDWTKCPVMKANPMIEPCYKEVCESFDALLASYGYIREGNYYLAPEGKKERHLSSTVAKDGSPATAMDEDALSEPTIVIFCHLGVICVVLSHLLNIPFPVLTHSFFLPTTSLTILGSEEHWGREAYFRVQAMGDVHHLLEGGEPVSSAGSFIKAFQE